MGINILWSAPEVNPINKKARSIPALNPVNMYGRVFFFSWFGFFIAFWSWYAFPPLLADIIARDIGASRIDVANSNIVALCATLIVRLIAGPCCDRFGPRWTFAGCLLLGAIPTFLAGTIHSAGGLMAIRFFVGILGGSFVPCQVWTTGFFDKNVVGTANSLTGGFGNAGGGVTYFVMPAVFNSLVRRQGLTPHVAWRVSFIVPGILILAVALGLVLLTPDCPTGKWSERAQAAETALRQHSVVGVAIPGELTTERKTSAGTDSPAISDEEKKIEMSHQEPHFNDHEIHLSSQQMLDTARGEVIQKPSIKEAMKVIFSLQTGRQGAMYFCSFGAELAINSILGNYYARNFPRLSLQDQGNWAAMFGLLNVVFRPLGGVAADLAYKRTGSVWAKQVLLHTYGVIQGAFLIAIGLTNSRNESTMFGLIAGFAFFLEGSNGLNYALVPHVHPFANGIVSGFTGACGNFGGIIFAIIFRYNGVNYARCFWIIGCIHIGIAIATSWIKPIPTGQIGGR